MESLLASLCPFWRLSRSFIDFLFLIQFFFQVFSELKLATRTAAAAALLLVVYLCAWDDTRTISWWMWTQSGVKREKIIAKYNKGCFPYFTAVSLIWAMPPLHCAVPSLLQERAPRKRSWRMWEASDWFVCCTWYLYPHRLLRFARSSWLLPS